MPGPVTHIVIAEKILAKHAIESSNDFYIGSLFPDIRMLGIISRDHTHREDVSLENALSAQSDFMKGFLLHSWIDESRESFVLKRNVYINLPEEYLTTVALKICEDAYLYDRYSDWPNVVKALNTIAADEMNYNVDNLDLLKWHHMNQELLTSHSLKTYVNFLRAAGFSAEQVQRIIELVNEIELTSTLDTYFNDYLELIDTL